MLGVTLTMVLAPLCGAAVAGFGGRCIGKRATHMVTISGVAIAWVLASWLLYQYVVIGVPSVTFTVYEWMRIGELSLSIGFLLDGLSVVMAFVVTFVSLMVHIYTIGYMREDDGYCRFFSYISLFTFAMLMLVMADNFLQLFFGWEAVGLVSYLLIGFWYDRPGAIFANMKAFLVNRVGDFGFLLGIAAIAMITGSLHYADVFAQTSVVADTQFAIAPGIIWPAATFIGICLFIGAMGKSAQVPLHVWLPDSMEGPTPISALIHAATMVTAGIFLVARMSPLFELSDTTLSLVLIIGAVTALFMGLLGLVQHDIKRVVAYSTLSQLGYMTTALGASAYGAAIFHLFTHAFFKALLFLAAGSVIVALHHAQDMRRMGGLMTRMPLTFITALIGTLALIGFPGTAGFFSKDLIIESVHETERFGAGFAYFSLLIGVAITALYSWRLMQLVFFGTARDTDAYAHAHETSWVMTLPLVLLAIPSVLAGWLFFATVADGTLFDWTSQFVHGHEALFTTHLTAGDLLSHAVFTVPFWCMVGGVVTAALIYRRGYAIADGIRARVPLLHGVLVAKYGFDALNEQVFARWTRAAANVLADIGDRRVIDGVGVNGTAQLLGWSSRVMRRLQTGRIPHYVFAMIVGLVAIISWTARYLV